MTMNIGKQIAALKRMTVTELRRVALKPAGKPTLSKAERYK